MKPYGWALLVLALLGAYGAALIYRERHQGLGSSRPIIPLRVSADCRLYPEGCRAQAQEVHVVLRFEQQPTALQPFTLTAQVQGVAPQALSLRFAMRDMDMGQTQIRLTSQGAGRWQAQTILPVCVSGRRDWQAELYLTDESVQYVARFSFQTG